MGKGGRKQWATARGIGRLEGGRNPDKSEGDVRPKEAVVYAAEGKDEGAVREGRAEGEEELQSTHVVADRSEVLPAQTDAQAGGTIQGKEFGKLLSSDRGRSRNDPDAEGRGKKGATVVAV